MHRVICQRHIYKCALDSSNNGLARAAQHLCIVSTTHSNYSILRRHLRSPASDEQKGGARKPHIPHDEAARSTNRGAQLSPQERVVGDRSQGPWPMPGSAGPSQGTLDSFLSSSSSAGNGAGPAVNKSQDVSLPVSEQSAQVEAGPGTQAFCRWFPYRLTALDVLPRKENLTECSDRVRTTLQATSSRRAVHRPQQVAESAHSTPSKQGIQAGVDEIQARSVNWHQTPHTHWLMVYDACRQLAGL